MLLLMAVCVDRAQALRRMNLEAYANGGAGGLANCLLLIMVDVVVVATGVNANLVIVVMVSVDRADAQWREIVREHADGSVRGFANCRRSILVDAESATGVENDNLANLMFCVGVLQRLNLAAHADRGGDGLVNCRPLDVADVEPAANVLNLVLRVGVLQRLDPAAYMSGDDDGPAS